MMVIIHVVCDILTMEKHIVALGESRYLHDVSLELISFFTVIHGFTLSVCTLP